MAQHDYDLFAVARREPAMARSVCDRLALL